ncbi:MAG: hypothetical protein KBF45_13555 [Cyclobacteriaceae bacterium]|jgi:hypothetical protein|nr:hypothetical protein [Cyclobacteriaceae bacterium]
MKKEFLIGIALLLVTSCKNIARHDAVENNVAIANNFVNAFYSFNRDSLQTILTFASESQPSILYYQKWAECGNYKIVNRDKYMEKNDSLVLFPVTVKDDLMQALQIDFNVTDTFHILIRDGKIRSVQTSSNDLAIYYQAKEWVKQNKPELVEKACEGIWEGGPTPCECIQGMIKGFAAFIENKKQGKGQVTQ